MYAGNSRHSLPSSNTLERHYIIQLNILFIPVEQVVDDTFELNSKLAVS